MMLAFAMHGLLSTLPPWIELRRHFFVPGLGVNQLVCERREAVENHEEHREASTRLRVRQIAPWLRSQPTEQLCARLRQLLDGAGNVRPCALVTKDHQSLFSTRGHDVKELHIESKRSVCVRLAYLRTLVRAATHGPVWLGGVATLSSSVSAPRSRANELRPSFGEAPPLAGAPRPNARIRRPLNQRFGDRTRETKRRSFTRSHASMRVSGRFRARFSARQSNQDDTAHDLVRPGLPQ